MPYDPNLADHLHNIYRAFRSTPPREARGIHDERTQAPPHVSDPELRDACRRLDCQKMMIGLCLMAQSVACFIVAGLNLMAFPQSPSDKTQKVMDLTFTLLALSAILIFVFSVMWLC